MSGGPRPGPAGGPGRGPLFWTTAAAGWALIAWGVRGALDHRVDTRPGQLARFLLGGALAHDLVLAPVVLLVGGLLARVALGRWRAPVQAALVIGGTLLLFAYPLVRGYGRALANPTSLPHDYAANLLVVLAAVAAGTAVLAVTASGRGQRQSPPRWRRARARASAGQPQ